MTKKAKSKGQNWFLWSTAVCLEQPKGSSLVWVLSCNINHSTWCWTGSSRSVHHNCGLYHGPSIRALEVENSKSHWGQPKCSFLEWVLLNHASSIRALDPMRMIQAPGSDDRTSATPRSWTILPDLKGTFLPNYQLRLVLYSISGEYSDEQHPLQTLGLLSEAPHYQRWLYIF